MVASIIEGVSVMLSFLDEVAILTPVEELSIALANSLGVLGHQVRRKVLTLLAERNVLHRSGLAQKIVGDDEIPHENVERVTLSLHHNHLPKLADHDYVEYDPRTGDVVLWKDPSAVKSSLRSE